MRRLLAFIVSLAMVFSLVAFTPVDAAGSISSEVIALETLGMLIGEGQGVTEEYTKKEMTRLTAAISLLKLRGLYEEALVYRAPVNFVDNDEVKWTEGRNILAFLKANPQLGFIGDEEGRFGPYKNISEQAYYKVLLETLGYSQSGTRVQGDFSWNDTLDFATSIGLKPSKQVKFTIDLLSKATVKALKTQTKSGKIYINILIDAGKIRKSKALVAGIISDVTDAKVKSVKAMGNTVIEVIFNENISRYDVEALDIYSVEGLTMKSVSLIREDAIRLVTSSQSAGKLYTLKIGDTKLKFTGVAKVSGAPKIKSVKSEDVETVVIEFDKELDLSTAVNTSNYTIAGVEVNNVELEGKKVTLSTYGLVGKKQYTVKVQNIKSIDGVALRSGSKSFYTRLDITPPSLKDVKAETNERVVVKFSEAVTRASAEDLSNYLIKYNGEELGILEAKLVGEEEDTVELTTGSQKASAKYEITVENIEDQTKAANRMQRPSKKTFYGMRIDTTPPQLVKADLKILSRNYIQVVFSDSSRFNEDTVLDASNYTVSRNDRYKEEIYVEAVEKVSYTDGKYKVMLRVEDLTTSNSYTVTAYQIEDEFGNVMEKNNSGTVTVARDDFAAATVKDYKVVGGNKIEIYFTKPLAEESAEDISNYEINNSIGAPMDATYKDEKVTLETAAMIEGKVYKLYIDGIMDRTGNRLKLSFDFRAIAGEGDFQGATLDYVYALNKYVVAAVFDEPVMYTVGTTALVLKSGSKTLWLYAKTFGDDGKTIEFSNIAENKTLSDYGVYTIDTKESLKGIYDRSVNKNAFDRDSLGNYNLEIVGNNDSPEINYVNQRDGKTFEMEMSKEVMVKNKEAVTIGDTATFDVKVEGEDKNIVTFTISSSRYIDSNKEYKIDIRKILSDKHGVEAENSDSNYTILYGEYKDEDRPYIASVTALDRMTVEIEYTEAIGYEGRYTIKNVDDSAKYKTIPNSLKKIDKNKVILSLTQPLEGRYEYNLIIDTQAKDLVGNVSEDLRGDEFYFTGTDLAPVKVPEIIDQSVADVVINKVAALPQEIKLTDKEAIVDAIFKYNALTTKQKQLVNNYSKLAAAQEEVQRLEAKQKKAEEEKQKLEAEKKRLEEQKRKQEEEKKRLEEEQKKQEEEKKKAEEERLKAEEDAKKAAEALEKEEKLAVAEAKVWLTADKLKFAFRYTASQKEPRILVMAPHTNGTTFKYTEIGSIVDDKFVKEIAKKIDNIAFLEIIKETGNIKVTRGKEDTSMILKVTIIKGNASAEKLFKVNIPGASNKYGQRYKPVTIDEVQETPVVPLIPLVPAQPIEQITD